MKLQTKFLMTLLGAIFTLQVFAQKTQKATFKVWGNCSMCKKNIEDAAKTPGVSKAEWNKKTNMITVVYQPSKVKQADIEKKIAEAGYDTEKFKGDDKAYQALDECCQYDRKG